MSVGMIVSSVLSPWGLLQALALVIGAWLWWRRGSTAAWSVYGAGAVGAALGAVGLGCVLRLPSTLLSGHWRGFEVMAFGALGGMALGVVLASRRRGLDPAAQLDRLAVPLGAMVALGRLGCFVAGCDFGAMTHLPWGVRFPMQSPAWHQHVRLDVIAETATQSAPVHPTQLYEVAIGCAMAVAARSVPRGARPMSSWVAAMVTYAVGRGLVELLRADEGRGLVGALSTPQWLALTVVVGAVGWWSRPPESVKAASR